MEIFKLTINIGDTKMGFSDKLVEYHKSNPKYRIGDITYKFFPSSARCVYDSEDKKIYIGADFSGDYCKTMSIQIEKIEVL